MFFAVVILLASAGQVVAASVYKISSTVKNTIEISSSDYGSHMRIMVQKGNEQYFYSLNNSTEELPVQLGDGNYRVSILENVEGNKFRVLKNNNIKVADSNIDVYLSSSQPVYWKDQSLILELGTKLTEGLNTNREKVQAIYRYIVENIKYDYNKIKYLGTDYVPDVESVLVTKSGICYDYSALFAALLRSQGIHAKLVKGYEVRNLNTYHAWNEVLLDGQWVLIDATFDAGYYNENNMIKNMNDYSKVREY